ncbi:GldG family protein [Pseudomonas aeruginosa]|nr:MULTISPECIES: GldG family protein [Pseudomonas]KFB17731.1 ABC transporter [Pseudomonas aeruginosa PGPR2]MED5479510.1 GldG family protein [Pseudomonadota bacterium]AOX25436.1 ABC transporter [Pseudomonas aeruginosa]AOX31674.1 ABC transporter [Pseudomonas aeruginosa]AOX38298.1 ABC transporter [Pseudomonas aeruginosa]
MKRVLSSGAGLLLIALAFLAFNMVSGLLFSGARLDLTEQKLYTISPGTKRILAGLDEPINLYFFYSDSGARELVPLRNYARRVEELLRAYEGEANGRIRLQVIDPEPFSENEDKATEFGLQGIPLQQGGDNLYFGLAGSNALDGVQVIPFFPLDQEEFLEYDISRLVQTLAQPQRPVVGLMSSLPLNGGFDMASRQPTSPWMVMEEIRQQFDLRSLKSDATEIPPEVSVLLLVHPKQLPEQTLYAIDQFVLRGGKLLAFVDPFSEADSGSDFAATLDGDKSSDLAPLFEAWGLRLLPGKVLGDGAYAMSISLGRDQRPARHPAWLSLPREALDQDDIATAGLESLTLATPGILERLPGASTSFTPLLQSSTQAMPFDASRFGLLRDPGDLMRELRPSGRRHTLAARIQGPAKSAFAEGIEGHREGLKEARNINVIVVADTDLLSDRMWVQVQDFFGQRVPQPWADNGALVVNALDNLSGTDALISVRSRGRFSRPFVVVERLQREAETSFRQKEEQLKQRLADTEQQLAALQQGADPEKAVELTPEQQATVRQYMQEKLRIRKELREVQYQLNADIDALGRTLKLVNIALVPSLLTVGVLLGWLWRRRRMARGGH